MEILDNIVIKNIRRFGEDVTIEVCPGATIFYAPNGTGKTSIFESIELALTGKVKRLDSNLKPLMRDKAIDSFVRLNFASGNYCQAQIKRGSQTVLTGNHDTLFNKTPRENIPYLLRLTHLLNQSADGWFVQSRTTSDAGAQLDYLSIGREAIQAKTVITGAKRAATLIKEQNQKELDEAKVTLDNWLILLNKKNSSISLEPSRPLIPYEELFTSISNTAKLFGYNRFVFKSDIQLIRNQYSEVLSFLIQKNEETSSRLIDIEAIKPIVLEYIKGNKQSTDYRRAVVALVDTKAKIEHGINNIKIQLISEETKFDIYNANYKNSQAKLDRIQRALELKSFVLDISTQIESYLLQIDEFTKTYDAAKHVYLNDLELHNQHELFLKREIALANRKSFLASQFSAIERWHELNKNIVQLVNDLRPNLVLDYNNDNEALKNLTDQKNEHVLVIAEAQRIFDAINAANDAVKNAVGIVISELSPQAGTCPVCIQQYEPAELHRRMRIALDAMNPELQHALSKLDEAKDKASRIDKRILAANSKLVKSSNLLRSVDDNIKGLRTELSHLINKVFPGVESVEIANDQYQRENIENDAALQHLEYQKSLVPSPPSSENLAIVQNSIDKVSFSLNNLNEKKRSLERTRDKAIDDSSNEIAEPSVEELVEMFSAVSEELAKIRDIELSINVLRREIEQQSRLLEDNLLKTSSLNGQLLDVNANLNRYITQWSLLKLPQEPSENLLLAEINLTRERIFRIEDSIKYLEQIELEIGRWLSIAEHSAIEKQINDARATISEVEYTSLLTEKVTELNERRKLIQSKVATLSNFSTHLGNELNEVHEIIKSINPLWNKLLKRIVIDPRFSETALNSYSSYNKQHANVNVPLHGENILAHHVASEAQITDLQLTFLLALAQNYEWTPWRALLLDDPTQHHDLVHASAVFDLLRDYVAEKSFQVLLATHDHVQAKFFMRKLQNDGIPARICTLQATSAGVVPVYKDR